MSRRNTTPTQAPDATLIRRAGTDARVPFDERQETVVFFTRLAPALSTVALLTPNWAAGHAAGTQALVTDPASLVSPFIGTANSGNTFPGADVPFGMVQWSPDTTSRPRGGGYYYGDTSITGFSLTHLSGPGCPAAGDVPVLPTIGATAATSTGSFSHADESARAGSYTVTFASGIKTELTATAHTGMARFTFPPASTADLVFKLSGSQNGDTAVSFTVVSATQVAGAVTSTNFCGARTPYTLRFDMVFDHPFTTTGTATQTAVQPGARQLSVQASGPARPAAPTVSPTVPDLAGQPLYHGPLPPGQQTSPALTGPASAYVTFDTTTNPVIQAKVGISYVSAAGAAANLAAENPGWDFSATQASAHDAWNTLLGEIQVAGGTAPQQQIFYTALYHALLHPNVFSDVNGQYTGTDGKIHTVGSGHSAEYTNFSGWDTYRTQAQLEALMDPSAASDTAQSMVDDNTARGTLPKWVENNGETYIMVGDPADAILADYYAFGARSFDTTAALRDMVKQAANVTNIRPGLGYLNGPGYLPNDGSYGCCNFYGPVSTALEYDTADFAISALAGDLGDSTDDRLFAARAQDWRNLLNTGTGFMQPRMVNGSWAGSFSATSQAGFVEGDSWQYTGMVPFDINGLAAAKGGNPGMTKYLDSVLSNLLAGRTGAGADLANEPSLVLPWEYDYTGQPYKTQQTIRQAQNQIWTDTPGGLAGNDDLGTMSAWFAWSALGLYPATPGTADLALGSPMFTDSTLALPSGNTLTIDGAGAAPDAPYVQSATWDGAAWNAAYAPPGALASGGTLSFTLSGTPNTSWGAAAAPPSYGGSPAPTGTGPIASSLAASPCVDDSHSATTNGNPIDIWTCNGTAAQQWTVGTDGTLRARGKCMDVVHSGTANGTKVDLYSCNGTGAQQWRSRPDGAMVNPESGKCLDDPGASAVNGTQLQIWSCNGGGNQKWLAPYTAPITATGPVQSRVSPYPCVDDSHSATTNGNPIDIWTCNGTAAQRWTEGTDGTVRVLGKCMDVRNGGTANGTKIDLYTCNGTGAQRWQVRNGEELVNPQSGRCLDDPGSSTVNGTQLQIWSCSGATSQRWRLP